MNNNLDKNAIYNINQISMFKVPILGLQHMFAMFGATILVPLITGLDVGTTLLFAGVGTLIFHVISNMQVPAFLGSSFAFLAGYAIIAPNGNPQLLPYACFGVACSGLVYLLLAYAFKLFGANKVMRYFPPIVTGPIIIAIGLNLSKSAIDSCATNWPLAILAIAIIIICNIFGRGLIKIIPILISIIVSYAAAYMMGIIDLSILDSMPWYAVPSNYESTVFSIFTSSNINVELLITSIITIVPISLATMMEHIGDISAISSTTGINYIKNPGLHKTLVGDGIATIIASLFGAPANTTYGENTGVLTLTKVYDPIIIRIAAIFAIIASFHPKLISMINVMPAAIIGGISLVLYGMISAVGIRNIVETKVDFSKSRNIIIAALILVLSIGINFSDAHALVFTVMGLNISLSGIAVGSLVGIILNAILPDKDYMFNNDFPNTTGVSFEIAQGKSIVFNE